VRGTVNVVGAAGIGGPLFGNLRDAIGRSDNQKLGLRIKLETDYGRYLQNDDDIQDERDKPYCVSDGSATRFIESSIGHD
jgi:hypothetical protein